MLVSLRMHTLIGIASVLSQLLILLQNANLVVVTRRIATPLLQQQI